MILQVTKKNNFSSKKTNWKDSFRAQIYKKNKALTYPQAKDPKRKQLRIAREAAGDKLGQLLQGPKTVTIIDKCHLRTCHSYYSSFIPLQMQARFDNELDCTFPFLKYLEQTMKTNDRQLAFIEICQLMSKSRLNSSLMVDWSRCLEKYLCGLDTIRAIQIYLQIKKWGTSKFRDMYRLYGANCFPPVFYHRITQAEKYFKSDSRGPLLSLSLDSNEQINQVTMPKTMKTLYCSVCLIYDCGQHALDDIIKDKSYQYVSPKNLIPPQQRLDEAIILCKAFEQLKQQGKINTGKGCSNFCYKTMTKKEWEQVVSRKGALMSPIVKGMIKIGIEMYSYKPCKIWKLLLNITSKPNQLTVNCQLVYKFLIDDHNLFSRLERKLSINQEEMLRRQSKEDGRRAELLSRKNRKKIKLAHQTPSQHLSTCCHYFVGEEPSDISCQSCSCRERGYCLPQCLCSPQCQLRQTGCKCKKEGCGKKCYCVQMKQECDPSICEGCFKEGSKCKNKMILEGCFKKTRVGRSSIPGAGLGLFAGEQIRKDDLVMIYAGELIDSSVEMLRDSLSVDLTFYNFGSPQGSIDARFMGNASRFINHGNSGEQNLRSQNVLSQGRYKIGFYAERDIQPGEQLFFNYDGEGDLYKNHRDKYPFIKNNSNKKQNKQ